MISHECVKLASIQKSTKNLLFSHTPSLCADENVYNGSNNFQIITQSVNNSSCCVSSHKEDISG